MYTVEVVYSVTDDDGELDVTVGAALSVDVPVTGKDVVYEVVEVVRDPGQLVTVGAQEVTVNTEVDKTVDVDHRIEDAEVLVETTDVGALEDVGAVLVEF